MTPVSICVIMKNEEKHLDTFLSSIRHFFKDFPHELILVDTGSSDNSLAIAQKYTDKIFHFQWIDDFSAARNFSLSCASYDWILVLDCDEYITYFDPKGLQSMIDRYPGAVGMISRRNHYEMDGIQSIYTDDMERFFNRKTFHYEAIICEQPHTRNGYDFMRFTLPLIVEHYGYNGSFDEIHNKLEQNNRLLYRALEENTDNSYLYFQLGLSFHMLGDFEKACYYYSKGLEYNLDPKAEYVQRMVIGYGYALLHLKRYDEALHFENIYDKFDTTADFVCLMGLIYMKKDMTAQAMEEFLKAASFSKANMEGANSFIPTFHMGYINEMLGDIDRAVSLYKQCENYKPALDRLKELGV